MLTMRFDMRAPGSGAPIADLYDAAIGMSAWADGRGVSMVVLSEHHGTTDNHLPSPLILAAAIAARTKRLPIMLAALVLPFCDPVRLAEEIAVLDIISKRRVSYVLGIGHRPEEYEHFGLDITQRGKAADEKLEHLIALLNGDEVLIGERRVRITPGPLENGGVRLLIAGGSLAAARRAGRFGLGIIAQASPPGMKETYEAACRANGFEPGIALFPQAGAATAVFVASDVDRAWEELGPYLLHDAKMAASYRHGETGVASISDARTIDELRALEGSYRIYTIEEATEFLIAGRSLPLLPLCGGLPPDLAWRHLEFAAQASEAARQS